jgi:aspartyl-tRNA(Asn)/glutamyl-tRNA(Gln) amidotransferase subunit C
MAITEKDVLHVARLAHLELEQSEVNAMVRDLGAILDYVAALSEVDTEGVEPMTTVAVAETPFRPDTVVVGLPSEVALAEAPRAADGGFAVPGFMDES